MNRKDYCIAERLPESLNRDNLCEVAQVIDEQLHELDALNELICLYPRIDELSSELVDALAIHFHVDFYDTSLSLDKRRALVKNSIRWHMKKGTKAAVEELVQTVFESGIVSEWFEYGGDPYRFKVTTVDTMPSDEEINRLIQAINSVKNIRSHLDEIGFIRYLNADLCFGGVPNLHKRITVSPAEPTDQTWSKQTYVGGAMSQHFRYDVSPEPPTNHEVQDIMYFGGGVSRHKKFTVAIATEMEE
ncbi:phage tail protein [uncultured Anaerovibrio sp.]|uniref:phage tail protein n=1 Tax=uncultured Anaerovibrio sp. TaxID=361586 RepID=UPI002617B163|nr:phage tail protein [uncultured Anaerovibrio sp.]